MVNFVEHFEYHIEGHDERIEDVLPEICGKRIFEFDTYLKCKFEICLRMVVLARKTDDLNSTVFDVNRIFREMNKPKAKTNDETKQSDSLTRFIVVLEEIEYEREH